MKITKTFSLLSGILLSLCPGVKAQGPLNFTNLLSFNETNGASPEAPLIQGKDGNFYGATFDGGAATGAYGTVFQLTPSGVLSNLLVFNSTNGASPRGAVLQGADAYFYGTTYNGGSNNAGTIFELTPDGAFSTLVTLGFSGGGYPIGSLIQGQDGNFYGTTAIGGSNGYGTVFKLASDGTFSTLVSFADTNGASPYAGLVQSSDGTLYGTTAQGGTNGGFGTLFSLTTNGAFTCLYSFTGGNDGADPYAPLVQGTDGNFYGTTFFGGSNDYGTIFKFTTNGALTTLVSFDITNGAYPQAGLIQASDGNFYGTTSAGGASSSQADLGYGTIFKLTTNGTPMTLLSFDGTNGASPEAAMLQGVDGNFYGTTASGGTYGYGTVFRLGVILPPPEFLAIAETSGTVTLTWSAVAGESYQILCKTNLAQNAWLILNNSLIATNPIMTTLESTGPDPQRFYDILLIP